MTDKADSANPVRTEAKVERKATSLPRFVCVPQGLLEGWGLRGTTMVEVRLNGVGLGRRSLKEWPERDAWFFDVTDAHAESASVETGDRVRVEMELAPTDPPAELAELLDSDEGARQAWDELTPSRKRMLSEHVRDAKRPETRRRRARKGLSSG